MDMLSDSFIFVFGYILNIFTLALPEGFYLVTKGVFGRFPKSISYIMYILLIMPFGWVIMTFFLFSMYKLTTLFNDFGKDLVIRIEDTHCNDKCRLYL